MLSYVVKSKSLENNHKVIVRAKKSAFNRFDNQEGGMIHIENLARKLCFRIEYLIANHLHMSHKH